MAPNVFWKGYLKLSLVTCAVTMTPATTEGERLRFNTLNSKTGHRVVTRWVDEATGKPVKEKDQARGYPKGEDDFVLIEDEELDALRLESTRTIDIATFVPAASIGWLWLDRPHFLTPADAVGAEAFAVIRAAMAATKTVGISRLVLARRERAVMLEPRDEGIIVWTLRYGDEMRPVEGEAGPKPDTRALALIKTLIRERTADWDPAMLSDPVQEKLSALIEARKKGRKPPKKAAPKEEPSAKVIDIMDALRKSIAKERRS